MNFRKKKDVPNPLEEFNIPEALFKKFERKRDLEGYKKSLQNVLHYVDMELATLELLDNSTVGKIDLTLLKRKFPQTQLVSLDLKANTSSSK